ncbi:MAG: uncharacterized protein QOF02_4206 [Blastocatellia bacterium]|jgi:uncharacterized protein YegP (UPF0339 family)|nr:uncharacterized protein [Blastocatellia bacterium]
MKADNEMLEEQLKDYEGQVRGLKSFINELKEKTDKHGTPKEHFEGDLAEAECNINYYDGEIARLREIMEKESNGATYWVYEDAAHEWRWQLRAANNRIIADSGEGYHHKQDCLHGIALVKDSKDAPVKDKP